MIRATRCQRGGAKQGLIEDEVTLDFDQRHRRRIALVGSRGTEFLLDLERAVRMRHGDALLLEDGRRIRVNAAEEELAEIKAPSPDALVRIAWHLGNRHLPVMLLTGRLVIRRDHVIEDMVRGLGASVLHVHGPFDPEAGAYADGHSHHHSAHTHQHGDEDDQHR